MLAHQVKPPEIISGVLYVGYSKQAYYKQTKFKALYQVRMERAKSLVLHLRRQMPRLGTRKLYYLLLDDFSQDQIKMGRDKLFDFLRTEGLLILRRKKYTVTTNSKHWMKKYPNLIKDLTIHRPEQVWATDITFIDTVENGNCYLHLITDVYSKQIMGYELCNNMEASSTLKALKMAIKSRQYKDQYLIPTVEIKLILTFCWQILFRNLIILRII